MKPKVLTNRNLRLPYGVAQCNVHVIRELPLPFEPATTPHDPARPIDTPDKVADMFTQFANWDPEWDWERESLCCFFLTTRRRMLAFQKLATGTMDTILVHARDVFRLAIVVNAAALVLAHNHPSGESSPSDADVRVTRDIRKAGELLKIELLDHVIVGNPALKPAGHRGWSSLREQGHFYS